MEKIFTLFLLFLALTVHSQPGKKKAFYFFDAETKMPVEDVMAKDNLDIDTITYVSNNRGQIVIPQSLQKLRVTHLNYKDTIITTENNKVLLKPSASIMQAAIVNNEQELKGNVWRAIVSPFVDVTSNMSHGDKAASLIPSDDKIIGNRIKILKYEIVDVFGVKNLKYLPFKAAIYTVDTATGLPAKPVYTSEIIKKADNKRWVEVDISSQHITMPEEGLFIVFEVLNYEYYEEKYQRTIWSKVGRIDAAPTIRAEMYNSNNPHKSFRFTSCTIDQDCDGSKVWQPANCHYVMEIELEN